MAAKNKENLLKLLDFLKKSILNEASNEWFIEELRSIIAPNLNVKVDGIYEYCIEEIIRQQAQEFYKDFVLTDLKETLIQDFIRMEHWRRRNNLDEFGMAVFQQVEGIVNKLVRDNLLNEVYTLTKNAPCYVDYSNPIVGNRYDKSSYSISQFILMEKVSEYGHKALFELSNYYKFKAIDYYICHQASLTVSEFNQFTEENKLFGVLYALRNKNHRGNIATEWEIEKLKNIETNPSRSFLTLTAFLVWFVDSINKGYPLSNDLVEFSKKEFKEIKPKIQQPQILGKIELSDRDKNKKRFK